MLIILLHHHFYLLKLRVVILNYWEGSMGRQLPSECSTSNHSGGFVPILSRWTYAGPNSLRCNIHGIALTEQWCRISMVHASLFYETKLGSKKLVNSVMPLNLFVRLTCALVYDGDFRGFSHSRAVTFWLVLIVRLPSGMCILSFLTGCK